MAKKKPKGGLRFDVMFIVSLMILLITFFAYMLNTTLDDVLTQERGENVIITHTDSEN